MTYLWSQRWFYGLVKFYFLKFIPNVPIWCGIGLGLSSGSLSIFSMIFHHLETIFEKFSKSQNRAWKWTSCKQSWILLAKTCMFLVLIQNLTSPTIWVIQTNSCIQRYFGSLSKTSRGRFFIFFLLFEKNYFFHSHASESSQMSCKLLISEVKNDFVGWQNSIF